MARSAKRELERNVCEVAKLPTFLTNYSFGSLLRKVADCDLNHLHLYYAGRAKMVEHEIERRNGP